MEYTDRLDQDHKWSIERVNRWYANRDWVRGINFLPSSAVNSTEMWQEESFDPETIERELAMAREFGFNSCRVFLPYIVWSQDRDGFVKRFDRFLAIGEKLNVETVPILFDDCAFARKEPYLGSQGDPVPGVHNSQWTPSPGFQVADDESSWGRLESYVKDLVGTFADDDRVVFWDLYNEPGNSGRYSASAALLVEAFAWAREVDPSHPLCAGVWEYQRNRDVESICLSLSDLINFHSYGDAAVTRQRLESLSRFRRPLVCTEWLHRPAANTFDEILPMFRSHDVAAFNWGLVTGRTQTHLHWTTMDGEPDPNPSVWQHDVIHADGRHYDEAESRMLQELSKPALRMYAQDMTPAMMRMLEGRGVIHRLSPGGHVLPALSGETKGEALYTSDESYGPHRLLIATINRTRFEAFGTHPDNEEILFLGKDDTKPLYLLISLIDREALEERVRTRTLSSDDFVLLRVKFNDPDVSFFTMRAGVPHGEAVVDVSADPPSFYVTESRDLPLERIDLQPYHIIVADPNYG